MAIRDTLQNWWGNMVTATKTIATTPVYGTGGIIDNTPAPLKPMLSPSTTEIARQKEIIVARNYHAGLHDVRLTDRLKQFLGNDRDAMALRLNFAAKVNAAPASRLIIDGFDSDETADNEKANQVALTQMVWGGSRMKGKRAALMLQTVRDGESFILIDYDAENDRPRWTPHQRYTDATIAGDGEGVMLIYPNGDTDQKPLYGLKRWTERQTGKRDQQRITVYYNDRIERYASTVTGWQLTDLVLETGEVLPAEEWNTDDGTETGDPLGIPIVHCKTPTMQTAAREAIPIQKGLNKTYVDMMQASDMEAFRILIALGWMPPDGALDAGTWYYTDKDGASVHEVQPGDSTRFIQLIDKQVALMADVTDTPLSLLQRSAQRAAEGTLQEEKESFIARVRDYAETIEIALEDAMRISRRLHNVYSGDPLLSEEPSFVVKWAPFSTRSVADQATQAQAMIASQFPPQEVWRMAWGKTPDEVAALEDEKQKALMGELSLRTVDAPNGNTSSTN